MDICIVPPREKRDTINFYRMQETNRRGNYRENPDDYELMNVIMINVGNDYDYKEKGNELLKMLGLLFTKNRADE